jgi:prepilin-type N-terminal cleavage/methylation domain-containing protein
MKIKNKNYAFTLIELLVVIVVLGILGVVGTDLFSSVIKGTNKANVIAEVKQNGQLAMDIIERNIREATTAENPPNPLPPPDYLTTGLILTTPSGTVTFGFIPECTDKSCNGRITMNTTPITSTDTRTGVSIASVSYNISSPPSSSPSSPAVVKVTMTVNQAAQASTRNDFTADVTLTTTVSLRTY